MLWQPSLPYAISETTNLFLRPAIPVIFSQDVPQLDGGFNSEGIDLGDIGFDASLAKTLIFGGRPWKFGIQYWYFIESPDAFGPDYQIRFSVSPVVKLPW